MSHPSPASVPTQAVEEQGQTSAAPKRASFWLLLLRILWFVVAGLTLGMFIAGSFFYFHLLLIPAATNRAVTEQLFPAEVALFGQWGLSLWHYAAYRVALETLFFAPLYILTLLIFWRKADEPFAVFVAIVLMAYGAQEPTADDALVVFYPHWFWVVEAIQALGYGGSLLILYCFPDGRFTPRWTRSAALLWSLLISGWLLFPQMPANPIREPIGTGPTVFMVLFNSAWYFSGLCALAIRYRRMTVPLQRQQTKWVLLGFIVTFIGTAGFYLMRAFWSWSLAGAWSFDTPGTARLVDIFIGDPILTLASLALPLAFGIAMLRYRLWDIDPLINRVLVYGVLTACVTLAYYGGVQLLLALTTVGETSWAHPAVGPLIVLYSILVATLLLPVRRRLQWLIDRAFYRQKLDFQEAVTTFAHELRTIITLPHLLQLIIQRITGFLQSEEGAIFWITADGITPALSLGEDPAVTAAFHLPSTRRAELLEGRPSLHPQAARFPLLLPLLAPQKDANRLIALLALGPRRSGQPYAKRDLPLLTMLATQAGTAIAVAQLVEVEQTLAAQRTSPRGRAEAWARRVMAQPATALLQLHQLLQTVGEDAANAALLDALPHALDALPSQVDPEAATGAINTNRHLLMSLARGYADLLRSLVTPEMLPIGLRTILTALNEAKAAAWQGAASADQFYRWCYQALTLQNLVELEALLAQPLPSAVLVDPIGAPWREALTTLLPLGVPLRAYTLVATSDDKLTYLTAALAQLRQIPPAPTTVEHIFMQGIGAHWTNLCSAALTALHRQAQLEIVFLTRQVVTANQVVLAITVTNHGRGDATNLRGTLLPDQAYTIAIGEAWVARLAPQQRVEMHFTVQTSAQTLFQPRVQVSYDDQEQANKTEVVTAAVALLTVPEAFTPIPNPYSPGMPLRPQSPLFFGREELFLQLQELLQPRRNNAVVVLTGQRRMGKTSLAQQLPRWLAEMCVTVYLDCQALAIDAGMANFWYDVALAIADALALPAPAVTDFSARPAAFFEREFLPCAVAAAGNRRLLLLFDEYEELEARVAGGKLEPELFAFLRHLMQHTAGLGFIFIGAQPLATLNPAYWSAFFNLALYRQVSFLSEAAARSVITQPVAPYLAYDDLALDKLWRVTAGHPYFLQLLCHTLVSAANREQRSYVLLSHVNARLLSAVELGEAHLLFLWEQLAPAEKRLLHVAAECVAAGLPLTAAPLAQRLAMREEETQAMLFTLVQREFLRLAGGGATYEFRLELLRLWLERLPTGRFSPAVITA